MAFHRELSCHNHCKKIKILFATGVSELSVQEAVYKIISSLPRNEYDITLAVPPEIEMIQWIEILNRQRGMSINIIISPLLRDRLSFKDNLRGFLEFYRIIRDGGYDIIHFHSCKAGMLERYLKYFCRAPKIITTLHSSPMDELMTTQAALKDHWNIQKNPIQGNLRHYRNLYESEAEMEANKSIKKRKTSKSKPLDLFGKDNKKNEQEVLPSLKRNFSWILSGNITYAVSKGLLMILIAKLGSPKMVGQFSLALAIAAPVFTLASLRLRAIIATDTKNDYNFSYYILLRLITTTLAVLVIAFIVMIIGYSGEFALAVIFIAAGKGIESISDIMFGLFENKEKMNIIGKSMMIKSILSVICMGTAFKITGSLSGGAAGLAGAWLIVLIFYDLVKSRPYISLKIRIEFRKLIRLIKLCIPLSIVTALGAIEGNISTYLVQGFLGSEILGYYSAIANLIAVGDTVINSLGSATTPRLAKYYSSGDKRSYVKTLVRLVVVGSSLGAAGLILTTVLGRAVLSILYAPAYGNYWNIFLLLMIASCLRYMTCCLSNSLTAARKLKIQPIINTVYTASIIIFSIVLIPARGIEGMAYAVIISSYVDFLVNLLTNVFTL